MINKLCIIIGFTTGFLLVVKPITIINVINTLKEMDIMDILDIISKFINL